MLNKYNNEAKVNALENKMNEVQDKKIILTPKGIAMFKAEEVGFISDNPTEEEMKRFDEFWREIEGCVIPYSVELYARNMKNKYWAETHKATAQSDEAKRLIEEINRRTQIPFHPDFLSSKDDTLQEGQPSLSR